MLSFFIRLAATAGTLLLLASYSGGLISVKNWPVAFIVAVVLGLANALIKPILMFIAGALTLPLSCITLGLWNLVLSWILSGAMVYGAGQLVKGFEVKTFPTAMIAALVLAIVNAVVGGLFKGKDEER
jgi:putative membrane protein